MERRRSVLLVEDNDNIREPLAVLLFLNGYDVAEARDGEEALNKLLQGPLPGLILLDLMMSGMDGWSFLDVKARESGFADIAVVVISAVSRLRSPPRHHALVACVEKPFEFRKVRDLVATYCGACNDR